jgi:hypothetical protein
LDIKALHSNQAVATEQRIRNLVRMLPAQVSDPGVVASKDFDGFAAISPSELSAPGRHRGRPAD